MKSPPERIARAEYVVRLKCRFAGIMPGRLLLLLNICRVDRRAISVGLNSLPSDQIAALLRTVNNHDILLFKLSNFSPLNPAPLFLRLCSPLEAERKRDRGHSGQARRHDPRLSAHRVRDDESARRVSRR